MVSSGLRAVAAVAVLAVLVMSSQGHRHHPKKPKAHHKPPPPPLCSDCQSLCNTNCTAFVAASCSGDCGTPSSCDPCKSQALSCCESSCNGTGGYGGSTSGGGGTPCCPNDCAGACSNCTAFATNNCVQACSLHYDDQMRCQSCQRGAAQACWTSCLVDCNKNCKKKGC